MIKFNELKKGDHVIADYEGDKRRGEVQDLNGNEKQVCVDTGAQSFWFGTDQLSEIPITEEEMTKLKFHRLVNEDGTVKFMKGAFRMIIPKEGDFSRMEIWYRDEQRHIPQGIALHTLQNHYYDMTKVHLNEESFD